MVTPLYCGVLAVVAKQSHKLEVSGSNPLSATMEKKIYALKGSSLQALIEALNAESISKEDIVQVVYADKEFVALFYK